MHEYVTVVYLQVKRLLRGVGASIRTSASVSFRLLQPRAVPGLPSRQMCVHSRVCSWVKSLTGSDREMSEHKDHSYARWLEPLIAIKIE